VNVGKARIMIKGNRSIENKSYYSTVSLSPKICSLLRRLYPNLGSSTSDIGAKLDIIILKNKGQIYSGDYKKVLEYNIRADIFVIKYEHEIGRDGFKYAYQSGLTKLVYEDYIIDD